MIFRNLNFPLSILDTILGSNRVQTRTVMTSGKLCQTFLTLTYFLSIFTNMLFVDNLMPSPIPAMPAAVETTEVGDVSDENGAVVKKLNMVVENIDLVIEKGGCMQPGDEDDETSNNNPKVSDMIELSVMVHPNIDLYVTTKWAIFPAPVLHEDDYGGKFDVMLGHGPWFDRRELEEGSIVGRYAYDGFLPEGYPA